LAGFIIIIALAISLAEYLARISPELNILNILVPEALKHFGLIGSAPVNTRAPGNGTFVSQNATLIALIIGAYSAYCLQQRGKLIDELREWWNEMVQAKSDFFVYCDKGEPSDSDYLNAFYKLSTAMDTLRLIYCNVARSPDDSRGIYPFEQVRDIVEIARSVGPRRASGTTESVLPSAEFRMLAKRAIEVVFRSLRHAIQDEAKASPPDRPVLINSRARKGYLAELKRGLNVDLEAIRSQNQQLDTLALEARVTLPVARGVECAAAAPVSWRSRAMAT
jgi:hypothetical protein